MNQPESTYDPEYFEPTFAVEDRHFWFRTRNRLIAALTRQVIKELEDGYRVIEIGFGTGNVLRVLESVCERGNVNGMDLFDEGRSIVRSRVSVPLVKGDVLAPPFGSQFDLVGLFDVLEHIEADHQALEGIHYLLKQDGWLLITVPAFASLWSYFDEAAHHFRRYSRNLLISRLQKAGFDVIYASYFMMSIFPLVWAGRRLANLIPSTSRPEKIERADELALNELRIVPVVNPVLTGVLGVETQLISRRISLPFGTSLVALARRSG
jgi:SAM-dependent methyltransferase